MPATTVHKWPGIDRLPREFLSRLAAEAAERRWNLDDLLAHIWMESGFRTDAKNPHATASGLIQMIDPVARRYSGVSAERLRQMSALEQLPGILGYFDVGRPLNGGDFRLLGYSRDASLLDAPASRYLYKPGHAAEDVNPGVVAETGGITVGSVLAEWEATVPPRRATLPTMAIEWDSDEPPSTPRNDGAHSAGPAMAIAGLGVFVVWLVEKVKEAWGKT